MHLTHCIQQLFLHISFQICSVLKTALHICAINARMGMIPIMTCSHHCNTINGSPIVNLERTQAISCTERHAGFMWDNCFDEVCLQMDSKPSSMFCINTRYLWYFISTESQDKVNLMRSVIAQCTQIYFFFYMSKVQASLLQLALTEGYKKGIECKLFPMPNPFCFSPFPPPSLKHFYFFLLREMTVRHLVFSPQWD